MDFIFSKHALEQMIRRGIKHETVLDVLSYPDQIVADHDDLTIVVYQSLINENNQMFLLRVFACTSRSTSVNKDKQPNEIVTLYKNHKNFKVL